MGQGEDCSLEGQACAALVRVPTRDRATPLIPSLDLGQIICVAPAGFIACRERRIFRFTTSFERPVWAAIWAGL